MLKNDNLKKRWPNIDCKEVAADINFDMDTMKEFALIEYYHIFIDKEDKKKFNIEELST